MLVLNSHRLLLAASNPLLHKLVDSAWLLGEVFVFLMPDHSVEDLLSELSLPENVFLEGELNLDAEGLRRTSERGGAAIMRKYKDFVDDTENKDNGKPKNDFELDQLADYKIPVGDRKFQPHPENRVEIEVCQGKEIVSENNFSASEVKKMYVKRKK